MCILIYVKFSPVHSYSEASLTEFSEYRIAAGMPSASNFQERGQAPSICRNGPWRAFLPPHRTLWGLPVTAAGSVRPSCGHRRPRQASSYRIMSHKKRLGRTCCVWIVAFNCHKLLCNAWHRAKSSGKLSSMH